MSSLIKDVSETRRGFAERVQRVDQAVRFLALLVSPVSLLCSCSCAAWKFTVLFLIEASQLEQRGGVVPSPVKEARLP